MTPCTHEYIEAQNYGQERDNVECRKCGQLWVRYDRAEIKDAPMPWIGARDPRMDKVNIATVLRRQRLGL